MLDNPEASTLTVRNLNISSYTFTVKALTSVGEGGENSITYQMNLLSMPYSLEVHLYCSYSHHKTENNYEKIMKMI